MTEESLDLARVPGPDSLQPPQAPGLPIRRLAPHSSDTIVLAGRRVVAYGDPSGGILRVTLDGVEAPIRPLFDATGPASPHPTVVEVGIDRLFRRWSQGLEPFEELWLVPLALPFAVRRWKWGERSGAQIVWNPPVDPTARARLLKLAAAWPAINRSWERDVMESASLTGDERLTEAWAWAKARLLGAVQSGPGRDGVRAGFESAPSTSVEAAWVALGLCALGRSDLASAAVRRVGDLDLRAHTELWANRWAGNSGPHPEENAIAFPKTLELPGLTDGELNAPPRWNHLNPVSAGAFCGRMIDAGLGLRPDSHFGRVRFGPFQQNLSPSTEYPISLTGLTVGQGRGSKRLNFHWSVDKEAAGVRRHTFEVVPDAGALPLQMVFEPRFRAAEVRSVWLDGTEVQAEITRPSPGIVCSRLQCELDAVRTVSVEVSP